MARTTRQTKQWSKSVYMDEISLKALDYLKQHPSREGFKFSNSALFGEFVRFLRRNPQTMLRAQGWAKRRKSAGKCVSILLPDELKAELENLEAYYAEHAPDVTRIRDGVIRQKRPPISHLYSSYVRRTAKRRGWAEVAPAASAT